MDRDGKMDANEYFTKREKMAEDLGVDPKEVPAEAVWYLVWPQPRLSELSPSSQARVQATIDRIAERYGLRATDSSE